MKYTVELQKVIDNMDLSRLSLSEIYALSDYMNEKAGDKFFSLMTPIGRKDVAELKAEISNHVGKVVDADTGYAIQVNDNGNITGFGLKSDPVKFNAASLNINLGGEAHNIYKLEGGERVIIDKALIGNLEAKTIKAGAIPTTHVQPGISFNALVAASIKNKQAFRKAEIEKLKQSLANSVLKQGEQNLKQIQEQEFKPEEQSSFREVFEYMKTDSKQHNDAIVGSHIAGSVKEGDIRRDGIITRLTAELQQQGTAIARSIHVEAFVDMFIHLAECKVPAGQEYKYAEHQARKMIEFIVHTLRK